MKHAIALLGLLLFSAGCGAQQPSAASGAATSTTGTAPAAAAADLPLLVVHKTPWCGCCTAWAEQAEAAGFAVELRDHDELGPIKQALGVPRSQASCHTAEIDGLFVEGHVPFEQIHRLLAERPEGAIGIAVPGMPLGSPGMEANVRQSFTTQLVNADGGISEYARHPGDDADQ